MYVLKKPIEIHLCFIINELTYVFGIRSRSNYDLQIQSLLGRLLCLFIWFVRNNVDVLFPNVYLLQARTGLTL